jgi:predicted P-loop ATPase/GTPase
MQQMMTQMQAAKPRDGMTPQQMREWIDEHLKLMDQMMSQMMDEHHLMMQGSMMQGASK